MKLTDKLLAAAAEGTTASISFEFFAPVDEGLEPLHERISRLARAEPLFVDVVGVGSLKAIRSALGLCTYARSLCGLTACLHVSAADLTRADARALLDDMRAAGFRNLLIEAGPNSGVVSTAATGDSLLSVAQLVALARAEHGDFFCLGVEGVPGDGSNDDATTVGIGSLVASADAGADFILTRHTYSADEFAAFVAAAAAAGVRLPVIPAVAVIASWAAYQVFCQGSGVHAPPEIEAQLKAAQNDDAAFRAIAVPLASALARALLSSGAAAAIHFLTLNSEATLRAVLAELGLFGSGVGARRRLPWRATSDESRKAEDVRPIFWGNRAASYVHRTAAWSSYPTGRWSAGAPRAASTPPTQTSLLGSGSIGSGGEQLGGAVGGSVTGASLAVVSDNTIRDTEPADTTISTATGGGGGGGGVTPSMIHISSNAALCPLPPPLSGGGFGELNPDLLPAGSVDERRAMWGAAPKTERDIWAVFEGYVRGAVSRLPWCDDGGLAPETSALVSTLAKLNAAGFLTINSQPRVDAAPSDDATFGWGGVGGAVYQKAYIECFCPRGHLAALMEAAAARGSGGTSAASITYHAVDAAGTWHTTNSRVRGSVNAVTWGVFPDREVLQPTVMDPVSFVTAWREEAFALWTSHWASIYEEDSDSHALVCDIADDYVLVNAVDNDYRSGDLPGLFLEALKVLEARGPRDPKAIAAVLDQQRAAASVIHAR